MATTMQCDIVSAEAQIVEEKRYLLEALGLLSRAQEAEVVQRGGQEVLPLGALEIRTHVQLEERVVAVWLLLRLPQCDDLEDVFSRFHLSPNASASRVRGC